MGYTRREAKRIGDALGADWRRVTVDALRRGLAAEREHDDVTGGDPLLVGRIALVHLRKDPRHYDPQAQRSHPARDSVEHGETMARRKSRSKKKSASRKPAARRTGSSRRPKRNPIRTQGGRVLTPEACPPTLAKAIFDVNASLHAVHGKKVKRVGNCTAKSASYVMSQHPAGAGSTFKAPKYLVKRAGSHKIDAVAQAFRDAFEGVRSAKH